MLVARRVVVGDAGAACVHVRAAELLCGDVLPGRRLHERRPADEDRSGAAHDDRLVAHRGHVRAACGARAHHRRDLRDPRSGEVRLVEEDPPEVVAVGEHLVLQREERAAGVDEVDARQAVLRSDLLGAQVLLHGQREVGATLDGRVVRDDHAVAALDHADPRDDPGARRLVVVELPRCERVQLEERRVGIEEPVDALARGELAARAMSLYGFLAAALSDNGRALAELRDELGHPFLAPVEVSRLALDLRAQHCHRR